LKFTELAESFELEVELLPPLLAVLELDELLQAAVNSTVLATTAPAVITCRARKIPSQAAPAVFRRRA
jgi:hypothetical protein